MSDFDDAPAGREGIVFKRWQDARDGSSLWRDEARAAYGFDAGDQWDAADRVFLDEQQRPAVTFNRMGVMVDAVCGLEVGNRQAISYLPREQGDAHTAETETAAVKWVRDQCHGEDEESEAFRDAVICGVGSTETLMDYDEDPDGNVVEERRDPISMYWDPAARKKCMEDARYHFHADWMDNAEIEARWPDKFVQSTPWDSPDDGRERAPQNADLMFLYKDRDTDFEHHRNQSIVLHYQCYEREHFYRVLDPESKELVSFEKDRFAKVRKAYKESTGQDLKFIKQSKKVYYRGFYCGRTELEYGKSPYQEGFTFKFITAKRDRNKKMWFGIVRAMIDPQKWANKWLSQVLHIINTNAKGGAFVEENALVDPRKAEEQWGASNPLIKLNEGGIGKIKERTPAATPAGLDKLMMFAFESLPFVSGINLEAIGLANREQAGVLEEQRRKAAYGILSPLFDALRLYRKQQGKVLMFFVREFISDGRLIQVVGQAGAKYVPLIKKEGAQEYDIIIDQSPSSPDYRDKTWSTLQSILPVMMKEGIPIPPSIFDFAPLPASVSEEFKALIKDAVPPKVKEQMGQMQEALQKAGQDMQALKAENEKLKADRSLEAEKLKIKAQDGQERNDLKSKQIESEATVKLISKLIDEKLAKMKAGSENLRTVVDAHVKKHTADKAASRSANPA